jgi:hypothetical protein
VVNVSAYPVTIDGRRLDDLALGLESSALTLGGLRSGDQPLAGLDGEVPSLNDSREPSMLTLGLMVRGTDPDGFVPNTTDGQALYRANLQTLKHLVCKTGTLLSVRRVIDKALTAARTNLVPNPTYRSTTGTVTVRTNTTQNPNVATTSGYTSNTTGGNTSTAAAVAGGGPTVNGQVLNSYRQTIATAPAPASFSSTGTIYGIDSTDHLNVTAGQANTLSCYYKSSVAGRKVNLVVTYATAAGAVVGGTDTSVAVTTTGDWQRLSFTVTPPATATRAKLRAYYADNTGPVLAVGDTQEMAGILAELGTTAWPYFDGGSPAATSNGWLHRWAGTANLSNAQEYGNLPTGAVRAYSTHGFFGAQVGTDAYEVLSTRGWQGPTTIAAWHDSVTALPFLEAGAYYAARVQLRSTCGLDVPITPRLAIYAPANAGWLSATDQVVVLPASGAWVEVSIPSLNALPAGLTNPTSRIMLYAGASTFPSAATFQIRRQVVEKVSGPGVAAGPYMDGNTAASAWTGTVDLSPSTQDSFDVVADAKVVDAITPEDSPGDYGRVTIALKVPGVYWRSLTPLTWTKAAVATNTAYEITTLETSSAPVDDAVVCLTGPANTGVQIVDDATGNAVRLNEALPAGSVWRVNVGTWESRVGVGLTVDSADSAGTDKASVTDQVGTYPRLLRLNPRDDGTGRRVIKVKAVGGGFTAATTLAVKARRAYL